MSESRPRAVLLGVQLPDTSNAQHASDLRELRRLVKTLGLDVIGTVTQKRQRLRTGTVIGLGKLLELAAWTGGDGIVEPRVPQRGGRRSRDDEGTPDAPESVNADELENADDDAEANAEPDPRKSEPGPPPDVAGQAQVVVVDHELSPRMQRNLEQATGAEVLDRTHVIVEIFHRHAKSREARLQVEMARLAYVAPRLRAAGAGSDRVRGGVGGKGAGESKMELDRRKIRDRLAELREELEAIHHEASTRRHARRDQRRVAFVGYTNAGKSSLMRALTGSGVYVANKLFATLDTTVRALQPETDPRILLSDTVGFIQKLPHQLVASFRSTLDEAREAALLLFVADASDPTFRDQLHITRETLSEIGTDGAATRLVLNKRDNLEHAAIRELQHEFPEALIISAHDPDDVASVRETIICFFDGATVEKSLFVPYAQQAMIAPIYQQTTVVGEIHNEQGTHFTLRAPASVIERLRARLS